MKGLAAVQFLIRLGGRDTQLDAEIPLTFVLHEVAGVMTELMRGGWRLRTLALIGRGVHLRQRSRLEVGRLARIGPWSRIDACGRRGVRLGEGSRLGAYCVVTTTSHLSRLGEGFELGARSGLGDHCHVGASGGVSIGHDVIAGPYVSFHSQEHCFDRRDRAIRLQGTTEAGIVVEDDCWIGAKATLLDGSVVRRGSVVAAGAVVRGEFPPYSILAGVPAKVVGTRS